MKLSGFTLVEMLVSIAIIAALAVMGTLGYAKVVDQGKMTQEISAARALIAAYNLYPQDNNGRLLPAIDKSAGSKGNPVWFEPEKRYISFAEAPHRYPFRLAPYFDYKLNGVILLNGAEKQIDEVFGKSGGMRDYGISMCPAFGLNHQFCGGYVEPSGALSYVSTKEAATTQLQASHSLIVFATAGGSPEDDITLKGISRSMRLLGVILRGTARNGSPHPTPPSTEPWMRAIMAVRSAHSRRQRFAEIHRRSPRHAPLEPKCR